MFAIAALLMASAASGQVDETCTADRNGDAMVTADEVVALAAEVGAGEADVADIVAAVREAIHGCGEQRSRACNGAEHLCSRRYDEVAYATTHNAMSNAEDGFQGPNQARAIHVQLEDGIRGLMLDTYRFEDDLYLCHSECSFLGRRRLVDGLAEIRDFLVRHPREVVTIIFEAYIDAEDTERAFADSGLLSYVHVQDPNAPWPTLGEMIDAGERLVVFTDRRADSELYPWYLYVWDYAFETPFSFARPEDLSCAPNRGRASNVLFILNHFLTQSFGRPQLARQINFNPLFLDRARECETANERVANFVTVDFYDIGDVLSVVRELNR